MPDVRVDVRSDHGRRQVGGVRQRRHLVAEIRAGDDRAGGDLRTQAQAEGDSHQADADGPRHGPRAPDRQGHQRAQQARGHVEHGGMQHLQAVTDHRRDRAGQHPRADQGPDREQDQHGADRNRDAVTYRLMDRAPAMTVLEGDSAGDRTRGD